MAFDDLLGKANQLHNEGRLDEAEALYRQILETAPENAGVMHFLAMIAVAKGAYDTAIDLLYKAVEIEPKTAAIRFNLAMALQGAEYLSEAIEQYKLAIKLDKDFAPEGYNNIANIYRQMGHKGHAKINYERAIEAAGGKAEKAFFAYNGLGLLYREDGKVDEAMEAFHKAIELAPNSPDAYANLATTLRTSGRLFEALPLYEKAVALDENNPFIWNSFGIALELDGKVAAALRAYRKAFELNPSFAEPMARAGALLMSSNKKEAIELLRAATKLDDKYEDGWVNLGVALFEEGLYMEAMESYRKAIELNPKNAEVCNNLAIAVHMTGDLIEAAGLCFNAMAIDKDLPQPHHTLAAVLADMYRQDKDLAIKTAKAWVKHCPFNPIAKHTLAAFKKDKAIIKADDAYVKEHFDGFAGSFDKTLGALSYRVPELIAARAEKISPAPKKVLDLGCGTGLVGVKIKPFIGHLVGVDLSPKMLAFAAKTEKYDELLCQEAISFLETHTGAFDMIVAGDVLCYFGALETVLAAAAGALKKGGTFIFTLEKGTARKGYEIAESGRFKHYASYVKKTLAKAGFAAGDIALTEEVLRNESGAEVKGFVVVATLNKNDDEKEKK